MLSRGQAPQTYSPPVAAAAAVVRARPVWRRAVARVASPLRPWRSSRQRHALPVTMAGEMRWVKWGIHFVWPSSSYAVRSQP